MIITMEQITNKMNKLDTLELADWLVYEVKRLSLKAICLIYDNRLKIENKVLEVFQDIYEALNEDEIISFFNLVEW